jgi:hypothetical protein
MAIAEVISEYWDELGLIGTLLYTALNLRRDTRVRMAETVLNITAQHRELSLTIMAGAKLAGLLNRNRDLMLQPITEEEERMVGFLLNHLRATFYAEKARVYVQPPGLRDDLRTFFSYPGARAIWEKNKTGYEPKFVMFVERLIGA